MTTVHDQFVGAADETTYGVAVAPTDFFEVVSESVNGSYERIESEAIRGPVLRADRFAPNPKGASGDAEFEVLDKGFDFWLPHMLGAVDTVTTPGTATATVGSVDGKSFTFQAARQALSGLVPFTYAGGKVTEWEISCEVDGIVHASVTMDFASENIGPGAGATALAVPTYPTGAQLLTFIGGTVAIGGTSFAVSSVSVTGSNGLKVDRYSMRGANSTTKREPREQDLKEFGVSLTGEFEDTAQSDRVAALTAAGVLAAVTLHFDSPQGGTLDITLPATRFDEAPVNVAREVLTQQVTGKVLAPTDGTSPLTVAYKAAV